VGLDADLEKPDRFSWAACVRDFEFLPALLVVRDEEFFDLRQQGFAYIGDRYEILMFVRMDCRSEKPAILFRLAVLRLLGIYDADDPHIDQTANNVIIAGFRLLLQSHSLNRASVRSRLYVWQPRRIRCGRDSLVLGEAVFAGRSSE
jgi:hypothetical protein